MSGFMKKIAALLLALAMIVTFTPMYGAGAFSYAEDEEAAAEQNAAGEEDLSGGEDLSAGEALSGEEGEEVQAAPGEEGPATLDGEAPAADDPDEATDPAIKNGGDDVEETAKEVIEKEAVAEPDAAQEEPAGEELQTPTKKGMVKAPTNRDGEGGEGGDGGEDPEEPEEITVTLSNVKTELLVNERIQYLATATGDIDHLTVFFDYHEEDGEDQWNRRTDDNQLSSRDDGNSYGDPREYVLFAAAYVYDKEQDKMVMAAWDSKTINVTSYGHVGDFDITSVEGSSDRNLEVTRGDIMTVKFQRSTSADNYWVEVYEGHAGGDHVMWLGGPVTEDGDGLKISVNTIELEQGTYWCYVGANGTGYENTVTENHVKLTVNDRVVDPGDMYLAVSNDGSNEANPLLTGMDFEYAVYCPGADWIEVFKDYDGNRGDRRDSGGDSYTDHDNYGSAGRFRLVAIAHFFNGEEGEEDDDTKWSNVEKSVIMNVTAPNGGFDITMPKLPAYLNAGDDLSFKADKPKNAYGVRVESWFDLDGYEGDNRLFEDDTEGEELDVSIDGDRLQEGMRVVVKVGAWGPGHDYTEKEVRIPVFASTTETKDAVLEVLKEIPEGGLPVHDDFDVLVRATANNKKLAHVQLFDGRDLRDDEEADDDGTYRRGVSIDEPGTVTLFARVQFEGEDNWYVTRPVQVKAFSNGRMGSFDIIKVNGKQKGQAGFEEVNVTRGNTVSIECEEAAAGNVKADHYWIDAQILRSDGNNSWWDWYEHFADSDNSALKLNTIEFEPGTYRISVGANRNGYEDSHADSEFTLKVEEMDIDPGEMYFAVSKDGSDESDPLLTNEDVEFSAYCPGADRIEVFFDNKNDPGWNNDEWRDSLSRSWSYGNEGTYILRAVAYKYDGGDGPDEDYIVAEKSITMRVTAPNGWIQIDVPEGIPTFIREGSGENISFTFEKPKDKNGKKIDGGIKVNSWFDRDEYDGDNNLFDADTDDDTLDVVINTTGLIEGDRVRIGLEAWGTGYNWSREEITIPVIGDSSDALTLTASKTEALVNENIRFTVDAGESIIEGVEFCDGKNWRGDRWPDEEDSSYTENMGMDQAGTWAVFAKVLLKENIGAGENGEDIWLTTEPVNITATRYGWAGGFALTKVNGEEVGQVDPEITVHPEEIITVEYEASDNADHYWIDADRYNEGDEWDPWPWYGHYADTSTLTTSLAAAEFEPGLYRLRLIANGKGYENADADHVIYMTVEESTMGDNEISFCASKTELQTAENFTFSAYSPSASRIDLICRNIDTDELEWDNSTDRRPGPGNVYADVETFFHAGHYTITATAYDDNDDVVGDPVSIEFTVTSQNGPLTIIYPEISDEICADNGLSFTLQKPEKADKCRIWIGYKDESDPENWDNWTPVFWDPSSDDNINVSIPPKDLHAGRTLYVRISAWGTGYEYAEGNEIEIQIKDHALVAHAAVAPTCTKAGNFAYWSCSRCGKFFSDKDAEKEIANGSWVKAATGHKWSTSKVTKKATASAVGQYSKTCSVCKATEVTKTIPKITMKASAKTKILSAKAKKKTTIKAAKAFKVTGAKGKVTYKKSSGDKKITVAKNGKITVKKGLKAGKTYKVKVKVTSAATAEYVAVTKTVTLKIKVK